MAKHAKVATALFPHEETVYAEQLIVVAASFVQNFGLP